MSTNPPLYSELCTLYSAQYALATVCVCGGAWEVGWVNIYILGKWIPIPCYSYTSELLYKSIDNRN